MNIKSSKNQFLTPEVELIEKLSADLLVANKQLADQTEKLRASECSRTQILANISHDLRAPVTALHCAIDSLLDYKEMPEDEQSVLFNIILRRVKVIERLLHDLQLLSLIDIPEFTMDFINFDAITFLKDYFTAQKNNTNFSKRQLISKIPTDLSVYISANPDYFTCVLDNLFSNAFNYSNDNDKITLGGRLLEKNKTLEIYIRDTGIGIPNEHIETIFERSVTLSEARTPGTSSSGLGLSIVKGIIEKHGAVVWCESEYGVGSTFYLHLPVVSDN